MCTPNWSTQIHKSTSGPRKRYRQQYTNSGGLQQPTDTLEKQRQNINKKYQIKLDSRSNESNKFTEQPIQQMQNIILISAWNILQNKPYDTQRKIVTINSKKSESQSVFLHYGGIKLEVNTKIKS